MIEIIGSGALGCLWAAQLDEHSDVVFVLPEPYREAKRLVPPLLPRRFSFTPYDLPSQSREIITNQQLESQICPDSTVVITTKSYDVDGVIQAVKPFLGPDNIIVLFQNGFGSQQRASDALGDIPCFAAVTTEGANQPTRQTLIHAGRGHTIIGPLNEAATQQGCANWFDQLATSKLSLEYEQGIVQRLWHKLAINCAINPFTALLRCRNGDIQPHVLFKSLWPELRAELCVALELADAAMSESELEQEVFDVMKKTANNQSSMLQDILKSRPTEINDINGFVHAYLKHHGRPCRVNKLLTEKVNALRH